jgi:hypothetical protein
MSFPIGGGPSAAIRARERLAAAELGHQAVNHRRNHQCAEEQVAQIHSEVGNHSAGGDIEEVQHKVERQFCREIDQQCDRRQKPQVGEEQDGGTDQEAERGAEGLRGEIDLEVALAKVAVHFYTVA